MFSQNAEQFLQALPYLGYCLGLILILVGMGLSPNGSAKAIIILIIGSAIAVASGILSHDGKLPWIPHNIIVMWVSGAIGVISGAFGFYRHRYHLSDIAIPMSLIAATALYLCGWSVL